MKDSKETKTKLKRTRTGLLHSGLVLGKNAALVSRYILSEGECASPGMHILAGNGDVPQRECTSSPGMGMCLNGDAHPRQKCISLPGIYS